MENPSLHYGEILEMVDSLKEPSAEQCMRMKDMVNNPDHYKGSNGIQCIDAMKASVTPTEFQAFLKLTTLKYLWRYEKKARPLEDIQKALFYLNRLEQELSNEIK